MRYPTRRLAVNEKVNHPAHYGGADNPYETIKVLEAKLTSREFIGAMKFQVFKYNDRALLKENEEQDYQKAQFYQNALVEHMRKRREKKAKKGRK
jgi:hypothetical protein